MSSYKYRKTVEFPAGDGPEFGRKAILGRVGYLAKQRREQLGLGRVAFAQAAGIGSDATVQNFEYGRTLPHGATARKLEKALGWKNGVLDDILLDLNRKATSITFDDLDKPAVPFSRQALEGVPTTVLLDELIRRLGSIREGLGGLPVALAEAAATLPQSGYDLAASDDSGEGEDERDEMHADDDFEPEDQD